MNLVKELNKHFEQKKVVQPQEKEKAIQNIVNDFRNAFENTNDNETNVSAEDILLAAIGISITELAYFLNVDTLRAAFLTLDLVEQSVGDSTNITSKNQASSQITSDNKTTIENAEKIRQKSKKKKLLANSRPMQPP